MVMTNFVSLDNRAKHYYVAVLYSCRLGSVTAAPAGRSATRTAIALVEGQIPLNRRKQRGSDPIFGPQRAES
jgi:hypothetical protein